MLPERGQKVYRGSLWQLFDSSPRIKISQVICYQVVTEHCVSTTNLGLATPNFAKHPQKDQPLYHRTGYTSFRFHQQTYPTESQTNLIHNQASHDSLKLLTTNISDQPSQQLYHASGASDTPRATYKTYEAGRCETKLDKRR